MGKIVISLNATLDGVVQDPDGAEGFERGGWFHRFAGAKDLEAWTARETEEALHAEALLLGRRSYAWFAARAPAMGERVSRAWAERVTGLPKYVVSSTLADPQWRNTTVVGADAVAGVSRLKRQVGGEILVYGSGQLLRTLIDQKLADELRLVIFPVALGVGQRLFDDLGETPLRLVEMRKLGDRLAFCAYALG